MIKMLFYYLIIKPPLKYFHTNIKNMNIPGTGIQEVNERRLTVFYTLQRARPLIQCFKYTNLNLDSFN